MENEWLESVEGVKVDDMGGGGRREVVKLAVNNLTLQRKLLRGKWKVAREVKDKEDKSLSLSMGRWLVKKTT